MAKTPTLKVGGPIRVAFKKDGDRWYAVALEFDIIGFGNTPERALNLLKELMGEYVEECIRNVLEHRRVGFFNPSDSQDWNDPEFMGRYYLTVELEIRDEKSHDILTTLSFDELGKNIEILSAIGSLKNVEIVEV